MVRLQKAGIGTPGDVGKLQMAYAFHQQGRP